MAKICKCIFHISRETLENGRALLTDILELIESNRSINRTESGKHIESIHLFSNVCIRNLIDSCYELHCPFSHTLPPNDTVLDNLECASIEEVNEAYDELLIQYPKLLDKYFRAFCTFYGKNKIRTRLRDMSNICAQSAVKAESFMQEIVNGFVSTGMPYSTAVDVLINDMTSNGRSTRHQMLVLNVAMSMRNAKLLEHLNKFETVFVDENRSGHKEAIEKLVQINLDEHTEEIRKYTLSVLKKCTITTYLQMNQKLLKSFLDSARMYGHPEAKHILHRIAAANTTI